MLTLAVLFILAILFIALAAIWHADRQPPRRYAYRPKKWG